MNNAWILVVGLVVGVGVGLGVGFTLANKEAPPEVEADSTPDTVEVADNRVEELELQLEELRQESEEREEELEAQIGKLQAAAVAASEAAAEEAGVELPAELAIAFGEFSDLEELTGANWEEMAQALLAMSPAIVELAKALDGGGQIDQAQAIEIAKQNQKLVAFAIEMIDKVPTHAGANGSYTHPIAMTNLLAEVLESSENGLSDQQRSRIARFGNDYEQEWQALNDEYSEDTLALQKVLDEVRLKQDYMGRLEGTLNPEQQSQLFPEETRHRNRMDLWSPALVFAETSGPLVVSSVDELSGQLMEQAAQGLRVDKAALEQHADVFRRWVDDVSPGLTPVSANVAAFYDIDVALAAGEAQVRAMQALAERLDLTPEQRDALLAAKGFVVPRLLAPAGQ